MKQRGFTLIELLVTLAAFGILSAVAVPAMSNFFARRAVVAASGALATDLRFARSEAIKRSNFVTTCRSTDGATCAGTGNWADGWIVFTDGDGTGNGAVGGTDTVLRVQPALTGIATLQNAVAANTRAAFVYRPLGIGIGQTDTLVISPTVNSVAANQQLICITSQGRAMVRPLGATTC